MEAPQDLPESGALGESQWSGTSGAGVFAGDALIGVVTEHSVRRGPSDITVVPLHFLNEPARAPANASSWWIALGVNDPGSLSQLPEAVPRTNGEPDRDYQFVANRLSGRAICSAVWSHAGDSYAVATDHQVELYDSRGVFQRQLEAPKACYLAGQGVQWDSGDRMLAVESDEGQLDVIDLRTGERTQIGPELDAMLGGQCQYSWSRDGATIAVAAQEGVYFCPTRNRDPKLVIEDLHFGVSMSPVEDIFAVSPVEEGGPLFRVFKTSDREVIAELGRAADTGWATSVDFNPTGQLIAVAFESFGIEIWSLPMRSRIATLEAPFGVITDVRWSSNGRFLMATTHTPQVVRVYRSETWQLLGELQAHDYGSQRRGVGVNAASVAPDGTVLLVPQGERGIDVFELDGQN